MYIHTPLLSLLPVWTCSPAPLWPMLAPVLPARRRGHVSFVVSLVPGSGKGKQMRRHMAHGPPVCTSEPSAGATPQPQSALSKLPTHAVIPCLYGDPASTLTLCQYQYSACTQRERAIPQVLNSRAVPACDESPPYLIHVPAGVGINITCGGASSPFASSTSDPQSSWTTLAHSLKLVMVVHHE